MNVLAHLMPLALGLAGFLWAMRVGQFVDLDGAASRAITDPDDESAGQPPP